jgi:hypothetical protein
LEAGTKISALERSKDLSSFQKPKKENQLLWTFFFLIQTILDIISKKMGNFLESVSSKINQFG